MCGIVGATTQRNIESLLIHGLQCLEYRGYDSAGIAIFDPAIAAVRINRVVGKVAELATALLRDPLSGHVGIAHTRWATHGAPNEANAHPHDSNKEFVVVHNGIIENHDLLRTKLLEAGYTFKSNTDTEVIGHLIHYHYQAQQNVLAAIQLTVTQLTGAFALGIITPHQPNRLYAARRGSPLVIGLGQHENFIASDQIALLNETKQFIYLQEGDIAEIDSDHIQIYDEHNEPVTREIHTSTASANQIDKGDFAHFMLKEIYQQPETLAATLQGHVFNHHVAPQSFGFRAEALLPQVRRVVIVACGTSYHAGLVARHWIESIAKIPCQVEIASENRYRQGVVEPGSLLVAISQSGETADTLAAVRRAKGAGHIATLGICNVAESALAREADLLFVTRAGAEIGVAATKTFTAQLVALLMLTTVLAEQQQIGAEKLQSLCKDLQRLPEYISSILTLDPAIQNIARRFIKKNHALFLGRGEHSAIAMEGALKLKEISYMHAEAYPAGELKHGPLALVDHDMPVVVVAPHNELLEKIESNVQEVAARGGEVFVITDENAPWPKHEQITLLRMPSMPASLTAIAYTVPLQLLSYHVGVMKGTNVDQPRNLAKSVTVE